MLFERVEKLGGEPEVAFLEVFGILGTVHAGEVEHEVGLLAAAVELLRGGVDVVFKYRLYCEAGEAAVLPLLYGVELGAEVLANETLGAGN